MNDQDKFHCNCSVFILVEGSLSFFPQFFFLYTRQVLMKKQVDLRRRDYLLRPCLDRKWECCRFVKYARWFWSFSVSAAWFVVSFEVLFVGVSFCSAFHCYDTQGDSFSEHQDHEVPKRSNLTDGELCFRLFIIPSLKRRRESTSLWPTTQNCCDT